MALSEFYAEKSIFITGATGLLGAYLLEIFLRCFPGIVSIYILVRPRKGLDVMQRLEKIFEKKIFLEMCKNNPRLLEKVRAIEGDVSKPNLGMSGEDMRKICEEVNIVFHCAACLSFTVPCRFICMRNSKGTEYVIDVCKRIKNLDILVYTSTAYANAHMRPKESEERVYTLPYDVQRFLDELENEDDESFANLVSSMQSKWNMKWPNPYTFSKCLAENILLEKASDLPVAIIRPSIICWAYKGTLPGYYEEGSLLAEVTGGVLRGYLKAIHSDKDIIFDIIPVDLVANCHIVAAWLVATGRRPSMFVVHCTSGKDLTVKLGNYFAGVADVSKRHLAPNTLQEVNVVRHIRNTALYPIVALYKHYIPAAVLDLYHRFKGSEFRVVKQYQTLEKVTEVAQTFITKTFHFQTNNFKSLSWELQPEEKKIFYTDFEGASYKEVVETLSHGSEFYNWDHDNLSPDERRRLVLKQTMVITFIKRFTLLLFMLILYFTIS